MTRTVDRYVMKHTLGKGGFGKVKYGIDLLTNQPVALKIIRGTPGTIPAHIVPTPISAAKTSANGVTTTLATTTTTENGGGHAHTAGGTDKPGEETRVVSTTMSEMPANGGTRFEVLMREVEILRQLNHPRITRVLDVVPRAAYEKANGTFEEMMLIVMELAESGDLHDLILLFQEQGMGELVARTYFHQLLDGVLYCHRRGVVHLDLKPENIFLDHAFQLKIGDFGLARVFDPSTRLMRTPCGTRQFASPEVFSQQGYDGCAADIWSCATILFCMVAGNPPFALPARTDWWFDKLLTNRIELFWKGHPRSDRFTPEFKDFIIAMLQPAPQQRMTLEKMLSHPWFTGPVLHPNTLYQYITSRKLQRAMPTPADSTDEGSLEGTAGGGSEEVYRSVQGEQSASLDDLPQRPPVFYTTQTSLPMAKPAGGKVAGEVEPGAAQSDSGYDQLTPEQLAAYQLPPDDDDENVYRDGAFGSAFSQMSIQSSAGAVATATTVSSLAQAREGPLTEDAILAALPTSVQSLPAVLESVTTIPSSTSLSVLFIELHRFFNSLHQSISVVYEPSACMIRVRLVGHESKFVVQLQSAPVASAAAGAGAGATVWVSFRREFGNRTKFLRLFDDTLQHFRKLHLVHNEDAASDRTAEKATPESVAALRERLLKVS